MILEHFGLQDIPPACAAASAAATRSLIKAVNWACVMLTRPDMILHIKSDTSERGSRKYDSRTE